MKKLKMKIKKRKSVYPDLSREYSRKRSRGAALIVALLVITVAAGMVLGVGRDIVASSFSSNRYTDASIASSLAWSGIEDGLFKLKNGNWTTYMPIFGSNTDPNYKRVLRRNVTRSERNVSIDYDKSLLDSGFPNWTLSDQYYDLRVSGSDDENLGSDGAGHTIRGANLRYDTATSSYKVLQKNGFYQVSNAEAGATGAFRFFDLSNYTGNYDTAFSDSNQRIVFVYELDPATSLGSGNITVNFFVKYRSEDNYDLSSGSPVPPGNGKNDNLECKPAGVLDTSAGWNFYSTINNQITAASNPGYFLVYIPSSCMGDAAHYMTTHLVEYLGAKFYFNGGATGKVYYGFRTSSNPPPTGSWYPNQDSYIGTGLTKILSSGIYGNVKKTINVQTYKSLKFDGPTFSLQCSGGTNDGSTTLSLCPIKIYRDTKY